MSEEISMGLTKQPETYGPLGPEVAVGSGNLPQRVVLPGRFVTVTPLDPVSHGDALYEFLQGPQAEQLWFYLGDGPYPDPNAFRAMLKRKAASGDPLYFVIVDNRSDRVCGLAAYLRIDAKNRVLEVGSIQFAPSLQRTPGATEAMYLMARYVFEDLGYRRYEWKCNALHQRSRRAAERLGFRFEGVFLQHMIVKGRNRDTAWFAMTDRDWPQRKASFERWLAPDNFGADGVQKVSLSSLNRAG